MAMLNHGPEVNVCRSKVWKPGRKALLSDSFTNVSKNLGAWSRLIQALLKRLEKHISVSPVVLQVLLCSDGFSHVIGF